MLQRDRIITKKIFLIVTMSKKSKKVLLRKNKILEIVFGICGRKMESL